MTTSHPEWCTYQIQCTTGLCYTLQIGGDIVSVELNSHHRFTVGDLVVARGSRRIGDDALGIVTGIGVHCVDRRDVGNALNALAPNILRKDQIRAWKNHLFHWPATTDIVRANFVGEFGPRWMTPHELGMAAFIPRSAAVRAKQRALKRGAA